MYFLLFHSIHEVLRVEKMLKSRGIKFELVPVPRDLSSDCGMSIVLKQDIKDILPFLANTEIERCFFFDGKRYEPVTVKP